MALSDIVQAFSGKKVVVLGDLVADQYVLGYTSRVSREAPVLVLRYDSERILLGGGANAFHNIHTLGGIPLPVGVVGDDSAGERILEIMKEKGIETHGILKVPGWKTVTKTRILAGGLHTVKQQIVRIDKEPEASLPPQIQKDVTAMFMEMAPEADAIMISDYGYGVVSSETRDIVHPWKGRCPVVLDSHHRILEFTGITAATPNEPETAAALGKDRLENSDVEWAGKRLLKITGNEAILITRGKKGMALFLNTGEIYHIPIFGTDEVADVTGAGDTVIATFSLSLATGADFLEAARLANYAGGIVVMKSGTATVSQEELLEAVKEQYENRQK